VQLHSHLAARHDVVVGGGYRDSDSNTRGSFSYSLTPANADDVVFSAFAQDQIALGQRVELTVGSKVEHDVVAGWTLQPTARAMWTIVPDRQHAWAAIARALRTPSTNDLGLRVNFTAFTGDRNLPIVIGLVGNPAYRSEQFLDAEAGYRIDVGSSASVDVSVFRGQYRGLATAEPQTPVFETTPGPPHLFIGHRLDNMLDAETRGVEVEAHWAPIDAWRLDAAYSGFHVTPRPQASSQDPAAASLDGNAPTHQWQLHSSVWISPRLELDGGVFRVGRLRELEVPAYTRVDARAEVKIARPLALVAIGQNLINRAHAEFNDGNTGVTATRIPRSATLKLEWRF
jgi:iron complex outermembrane receptor protein